MKFNDKLAKVRKDKNLSQEQLADRLMISRQSISKWENGSAYPDMSKILKICEVLDCKLEDLIDDGYIGDTKEDSDNDQKNINKKIKTILNVIKNFYNMFSCMTFKQKLKMFFEMIFISMVLFIISLILFIFLSTFTENLFYAILRSNFAHRISSILVNVYILILFIISSFVLLYLIKIRYLDYYVTIIDPLANNKTIEDVIVDNDIKNKEKIIIIRDKKDSYNMFSYIFKFCVCILKFIVFIILMSISMLLLVCIILASVSIYHVIYNNIFLFIAFIFIGAIISLTAFFKLAYNFIFNQKNNYKIIFYMGIIGLIISGVFTGLSISKSLSMIGSENKNLYAEYKVEKQDINYDENTELLIADYYVENVDYVTDEKMEDKVSIEIKSMDFINLHIESYERDGITKYYLMYGDVDFKKLYKFILENLKRNIIIFDKSNKENEIKVKIIANSKNIELIKSKGLND